MTRPRCHQKHSTTFGKDPISMRSKINLSLSTPYKHRARPLGANKNPPCPLKELRRFLPSRGSCAPGIKTPSLVKARPKRRGKRRINARKMKRRLHGSCAGRPDPCASRPINAFSTSLTPGSPRLLTRRPDRRSSSPRLRSDQDPAPALSAAEVERGACGSCRGAECRRANREARR